MGVKKMVEEEEGEWPEMRNGMNMMMMVMKPAWLQGLMGETFFGGCGVHENRRKNEKNIFCLHCCLSICPHCLPSHRSHPLLQVRRYVYHDVVRLGDLEKLIDCSYVQPYTINGAKVIFLNHRPQSRSCKGPSNVCLTCDRILQDPFHFCSLSCKVDHMVYRGQDLSSILYRFENSEFSYPQFEELGMEGSEVSDDDGQITPNSMMGEEPFQYKVLSYPNEATSNAMSTSNIIEMVPSKKKKKKKKKSPGVLPEMVISVSSRRKGAPQRSPLS